MEAPLFWIIVCCTMSMSPLFQYAVNSHPIKFDFLQCHDPDPERPQEILQCCPIKPTRPVVNGLPPLSSTEIRVRKAAQCTDAAYAAKLHKAYALMRALPDDDPRSFTQQWKTHCAYCGASFLTPGNKGIGEPIDIHFTWLFYPWHRYFLFFHERILQWLLRDPTFSLNYWNWDNPYSVGDGSESKNGACLKQGHDFPIYYSDSSTSLYDGNRSENAKGKGRLHFPDLTYMEGLRKEEQALYNASEQEVIESNLNVMYQALMSGGTTAETFMGTPYRARDGRATPLAGGSLELTAHASVHEWTGEEPPSYPIDMGKLLIAARDPLFYAHHANIDRLWAVWKSIGSHSHYSDPDFLNVEFLLYDENKDLRRVKVVDALDTEKLGYVYQGANDAAWMYLNQTRCSMLSKHKLIAQAQRLPSPVPDSEGYYELQAESPFIMVVHRPKNPHGLEEFVKIDGIKLDRSGHAGFDVFMDFLNPGDYKSPWRCAEYSGRFANMAQVHHSIRRKQELAWKQSITRTLVDIQSPKYLSKVVITLIPFPQSGHHVPVKFRSITIDI